MAPTLRSVLLSLAFVLTATGCVSSDEDPADPSGTPTGEESGDPSGLTPDEDLGGEIGEAEDDTGGGGEEVVPPSNCGRAGFDVAFEYATTEPFGLQYTAASNLDAPQDLMMVQRFDDFGGPTEPGTYSLDGINYADCGLCLLAFSNCSGTSCDKTFYAEEGSVTITAIGGLGDPFVATLNNVVFEEVTIDPNTWVSTPVPGGETWCVDGHSFNEVVLSQDEAICSRPDIACVGETVNDFQLQNCATEEMVSISSLTADSDALWLVAVAGWCSACATWVPEVQRIYDARQSEGLEVAFVLGENGNYGQPSLSYCRNWAANHDADDALFYVDHDGEVSFASLFANVWPYLDDEGMFALPWNAVLEASTHKLSYADGGGGRLETALDELLAE